MFKFAEWRHETESKVRIWVPKFVKSLRLKYINQANWAEWQSALLLPGMLTCLHGLFPLAFCAAFGTDVGQALREDPQLVHQDEEAVRDAVIDLAKVTRAACDWWLQGVACGHSLYLLAVVLQPQERLMAEISHSTSASWDVACYVKRLQGFPHLIKDSHKHPP